jgi:hypothetical protein
LGGQQLPVFRDRRKEESMQTVELSCGLTAPAAVSAAKQIRAWPLLAVVVMFLLLELFTRSLFFADTMIYVAEIQSSLNCPSISRCPQLWDAGHLLWRPLGHVLAGPLLPILNRMVANDDRMAITLLLMLLNDTAMLIAALFLYSMLLETTDSGFVPLLLTAAFLCANASLNTLHSGVPYGVGLAFLSAALWQVQRASKSGSVSKAAVGGFYGAIAVCFWIPYIVALPPLLLWLVLTSTERRVQKAAGLIGAAALTGAIVFGLGAHFRGVESISDFRIWFNTGGHGTEQNRNLIRSLFGLPRSLLNMGEVGIILKQFLFKDPYARVSLKELFWLSLWKIALFYIALGSFVFLFREQSRKILAIFGTAFLFSMALAIVFEGGSAERYLPLYPFFFAAAAACLSLPKVQWLARIPLLLLFSVMIVTNVLASSAARVHADQDEAAKRIAPLLPLRSGSYVYTLGRDSVSSLHNDAPFHEINRDAQFEVEPVYMPMMRTAYWRDDFAANVLSTWERGGDVWVTSRVWSERPRREWFWVEGDDPNVTWKGIVNFFQPLEHGAPAGDNDGFVQLSNSEPNKKLLIRCANR